MPKVSCKIHELPCIRCWGYTYVKNAIASNVEDAHTEESK